MSRTNQPTRYCCDCFFLECCSPSTPYLACTQSVREEKMWVTKLRQRCAEVTGWRGIAGANATLPQPTFQLLLLLAADWWRQHYNKDPQCLTTNTSAHLHLPEVLLLFLGSHLLPMLSRVPVQHDEVPILRVIQSKVSRCAKTTCWVADSLVK